MKFLSEKRQITIWVIVAIIVATILFEYLPLRRKLSGVKRTLAEQKLAIMKSHIDRQQQPEVQILLDGLKGQVEKFDSQIPGDRNLGLFLQEITTLMNYHGLREQYIQPDVEIETTNLNCIPIDMQCKGTLQQLFGFYKDLQSSDRLVRIESVSFRDRDYTGMLSMKAKAIVYYLN